MPKPGETWEQYVARQDRYEQEDAERRMAADASDVMRPELPGDRPEVVGPSGVYGFRRVDAVMPWETEGPVIQVVEATNRRQWIATPARHYAEQVARTPAPLSLAIDSGMGWFLPAEDVETWVAFARRVLEEASDEAERVNEIREDRR